MLLKFFNAACCVKIWVKKVEEILTLCMNQDNDKQMSIALMILYAYFYQKMPHFLLLLILHSRKDIKYQYPQINQTYSSKHLMMTREKHKCMSLR